MSLATVLCSFVTFISSTLLALQPESVSTLSLSYAHISPSSPQTGTGQTNSLPECSSHLSPRRPVLSSCGNVTFGKIRSTCSGYTASAVGPRHTLRRQPYGGEVLRVQRVADFLQMMKRYTSVSEHVSDRGDAFGERLVPSPTGYPGVFCGLAQK